MEAPISGRTSGVIEALLASRKPRQNSSQPGSCQPHLDAQHGETIVIQRVYDAPIAGDATRVLVDRIWPRGLTKERAAVTLWLKEIAPTDTLGKWFNHTRCAGPNSVRATWLMIAFHEKHVAG